MCAIQTFPSLNFIRKVPFEVEGDSKEAYTSDLRILGRGEIVQGHIECKAESDDIVFPSFVSGERKGMRNVCAL